MRLLGRSALVLIVIGLVPSAMALTGLALSRIRGCETMRLEGPGDCPFETGLVAAWLLNVFAWPILALGLILGAIWLWRRHTAKTLGNGHDAP